ncbi:hypothetical protein HZS_179 [Henneguya salminicola]|nr:hypothetical protein HZS_179 [Henneguya salminicola]
MVESLYSGLIGNITEKLNPLNNILKIKYILGLSSFLTATNRGTRDKKTYYGVLILPHYHFEENTYLRNWGSRNYRCTISILDCLSNLLNRHPQKK